MRNRCHGQVFEHVLKLMGENYHRLRALCLSRVAHSGNIMSMDDVFHETILLVIKDRYANHIINDNEFVQYFMYRANMVLYQTTQDNYQEKKDEYAYYIQTKASSPDEW